MPIYEYQCTNCGHQLEVMQKFSDAPLTECPSCHQADLQKLISSSAFHLKGGGWYVTDIRDKGKPKADAEPSSDTGASETKETKTDSSSGDKSAGGGSSSSNDQAAG